MDATTPSGTLVFGILGLMVEFERDMLQQRTNAGLVAATKRGRPRSLGPDDIKKAKALLMFGQ